LRPAKRNLKVVFACPTASIPWGLSCLCQKISRLLNPFKAQFTIDGKAGTAKEKIIELETRAGQVIFIRKIR